MAKGHGSGIGKGARHALTEAMTHLVGEAKGAVDPLSKRAGKELRKLEKRLLAARATEARRLRQLTAAQGSKGHKTVTKRSRQAGEAAQEVAALAGKIASLAAPAGAAAEPASTPAVPGRAATPTPRTTRSTTRKRARPADGSAGNTST